MEVFEERGPGLIGFQRAANLPWIGLGWIQIECLDRFESVVSLYFLVFWIGEFVFEED